MDADNLHIGKYITWVITNEMEYLVSIWTHPIRLAFIDRLHAYDHTKSEIERLCKYMMPTGWLVFHDYGRLEGVTRAVNEFLTDLAPAPTCYFNHDYLIICNMTTGDGRCVLLLW